MKRQELNQIVKQSDDRRLGITISKGREYTRGEDDCLSNFKRVAVVVGLTPLQVWMVYFHKHLDALASFIKTGKESSNESIEGRIDDMQNYMDLCRGLIHEHKDADGVTEHK